ncbi:hypothetical protein REPUB_Repub18cG0086100 [Reevesia pubescens]
MKNQNLGLGLRTLLYIFMLIGFTACFEDNIWDDPSLVFKYNRFPEIEKHCSPYLTSAAELKPDDSRSYRLKDELSFSNGDWKQVKNVNPEHQSENSVSLSGIMTIGISRNGSIYPGWYSKFFMIPGLSVLPIVFEGVYIETEEDGGERLLCLLGNSTLPSLNRLDDSLDLANKYGLVDNDLPHVMQGGQMLLVLRYPKFFNLTKRAIRGEIRSLNSRQSFTYFDKVSISALLGPYWKYQFRPDLLKSKTCNPLVYQDEMIEDGVKVFNGSGFCQFLRYVSGRMFNVMPNYSHHSKLDPILFEKEFAAVGLSFDNAHLILQHVKCVPDTTCNSNHCGAAKVFAVLRAIHAGILRQEAESMTGLSGLTISAEGMWTSSSRQLCMMGCLGEISSGLEGCNSQISLYFPLTLSIKQRSIILGSISSFDKEPGSYFPLVFDAVMSPRDEDAYYGWYPALEDRGELLTCLDNLSADLHTNAHAILNSPSGGKRLRILTQLEVISLGDMHLIGCRKVDMHLYGGVDIERGLDCLIEVKVQYPPENTQWLKNSMVKMKITSLRNEEDPLHFNSISLQALTVQHRDILEDVAFRIFFERILRILALTMMIGITWSQLSYMKRKVDTVPYISLVRFALQVLLYSLPLISNAEILFKSKELKFDDNIKYRLESYQLSFDVLDNVGRLLLLSALLLNASRHMHTSEAASMFQLWMSKLENFVNFPQVLENFLWQINVAPLQKVYYIGLTFMRLILHIYDLIRDPILDPYSEDAEIVDMDLSIYSNLGSIAVSLIMIALAIIVHVQQSLNHLKISKWQNSGYAFSPTHFVLTEDKCLEVEDWLHFCPVMEILPLLLHVWTLLSLVMISFSALLWDLETPDNPSIVYTYNRFSEIEENCDSILSLASELRPDDDRGNRIKKKLSFLNGDWDQQSGGAPLMPFDDSDLQRNDTGITRDNSFTYKPFEWSPKFKMVPGSSTITILFEGVYIESKENGERLMCLTGNATRTTRNEVDSLEHIGEYCNQYKYQPPLANDDRIMLVLHYPKIFSLTTRVISGEMFGAEELLKACSSYPYQDNMVDKEIKMFAGDDFCEILQNFVINHIFYFVPNWESFNADNNDSHWGPFLLGKEIKSTGGCFDNLKLVIQQLRCEPGIDQNNVRTSKVFAVFRVFHYCSWKDRHLSEKRTGLSGTTLSAEGIWRSSEGQVCMIGCLGLEGASSDECNTRICLYLPRNFSFKQRSILFGTISSTNGSHVPLLFEKVYSTPNFISNAQVHKTNVEIQILSIGSLFGEYWYQHRWNIEQQIEKSSDSDSDSEIIEISGHLTITSQHYSNISLSFEGLYDQISGKMHVVGCRDVRYLPQISKMGTNLEGGMDCQFEVNIEYPPENARWVMIPMVKISFSCKRTEEDPLHFSKLCLKTNPISYIKKSKDIVFRKTFEGILRLLMLTLSILCTHSQLHYSKNAVSCSEASLVMLAIQALGYCIPLITGNEILFRWKVLQSNSSRSYNFNKFQRFDLLDSMTKILLLVALFLTIRLSQIALESCIKQKVRIDREKKSFLIIIVVHVMGFLLRHFSMTSAGETLPIPKKYSYVKGNTKRLLKWLIEIDDYAGLVLDFLLLPQIINNSLWKVKSKPLRKLYYVGFTTLRIGVHAYDYIRDPLPDKDYNYSDEHHGLNSSLGLYSKTRNITTAIIVIILAVILYIQQQYDYGKLSQRVKPKEK